jgi:O-6-methylguanine DNA methyltransferase
VHEFQVKVLPSVMRASYGTRKINSILGSLNLHQTPEENISRKVFCASFEAPIGIIYVASTEKGLCKIALPKDGKSSFFGWINENFSSDEIVDDRRRNSVVIRQLNEYFVGKRTRFDLDVDLIGTKFQQRIWMEIAKVPYGRVSTYKQIAKQIHSKGYRAVGATIGKNPIPIVIPCHRIVGSNLKLVGYSGGIKLKEYLLRLEGIILV